MSNQRPWLTQPEDLYRLSWGDPADNNPDESTWEYICRNDPAAPLTAAFFGMAFALIGIVVAGVVGAGFVVADYIRDNRKRRTEFDLVKVAAIKEIPVLKALPNSIYEAQCPFCKGDHLRLDPRRGKWRCAECGKKGDTISFYAKLRGIPKKKAYWELSTGIVEGKQVMEPAFLRQFDLYNISRFIGIQIVREYSSGICHAKCPFCGDYPKPNQASLFLDCSRDKWWCVKCKKKGDTLSLYSGLRLVDNLQAYQELMTGNMEDRWFFPPLALVKAS